VVSTLGRLHNRDFQISEALAARLQQTNKPCRRRLLTIGCRTALRVSSLANLCKPGQPVQQATFCKARGKDRGQSSHVFFILTRRPRPLRFKFELCFELWKMSLQENVTAGRIGSNSFSKTNQFSFCKSYLGILQFWIHISMVFGLSYAATLLILPQFRNAYEWYAVTLWPSSSRHDCNSAMDLKAKRLSLCRVNPQSQSSANSYWYDWDQSILSPVCWDKPKLDRRTNTTLSW